MGKLKKQHRLAVGLLKKLGLDNIRLELGPDGRYRYHAWMSPSAHNGSGRISRRGILRVK